MASLHKQPGKPNWFCAYIDQTGKRHFRSTGTIDKRQAWQVAATWTKAVNLAKTGKLGIHQAREVIAAGIADVLAAGGQTMPSSTIKDWCCRWLQSKSLENEPSTHSRYEIAINAFTDFLGSKIDRDLDVLTSEEILQFRDKCSKGLSIGTTNTHLKILRACFNSAVRQGIVSQNPATQVSSLKERGENKRRALTLDEIQKVLKTCGNSAWRGLVLVGLYTGQRLGDCASLTWGQVDLLKKEIMFTTKKTGKRLSIHLAKPLADYLESLPSADKPNTPVFPGFSDSAAKNISSLSNAFAMEVLIPAGLMQERPKDKKSTNKGRTGLRQVNEITFHSLRHSFVTMLKATGASQAMAQMIVGHDSPAISRRYTHLTSEDTVDAVNKLPDVT